ncbi:MAG: DUF362 domain-containing protein [Opitutaceae bacterium]|jgi:uncharacterized protein (DUF362 family)
MNGSESFPPPAPGPTRRAFIRRSLEAGAAIAATGGLAAWLWNRHPPGTLGRREAAGGLPDFSVRDNGTKMAIITGADRVRTLRRGLDALGGIGRFIRRGDRVLVKVNAAFAAPAILSATTHPDLAAELVRLCLGAGASAVLVTDNPINDPESCFALSGIGAAVAAAGGIVVLPRAGDFAPGTLPGGRLIRDWPVLRGPFRGVTKLVGAAPVKDHARAGASMTIKNWYGLLGGRRNQFHQDINGIIVELAQLARPTFVVLDGTMTMMTNGPTGGSLADLKPTHALVVGTDPVAADAYGATLLGKTHRDLPYLGRAAALGCGTTDYDALKPARDSVS